MGVPPDIFTPLLAHPERGAIFLDFDGTLSPIVDDPREARPLPVVPDLLRRLAERFAMVAVISGRPVSFLHEVLGDPTGVRLIGLYGLEQIDEHGQRRVAPGAEPWHDVMAQVVRDAEAAASPGVYVEPKGLTVTVHWRHAPEAEGWVLGFVDEQAQGRGLQVHPGRFERELRPPIAVDKGTVVRDLVGAHRFEALAAFGDDIGDLPAFDALSELARDTGVPVVRVAVVDGESPAVVAEGADLTVEGAQGAVALLELLARG